MTSTTRPTLFPGLLAALAISTVASCGDYGGMYGSDFGATQGGVQDMSFARDLIDNATVPPPEAFVVEGMFSEHDLGLTGRACDTLLCLRAAGGVAPTLDGTASAWLQVGMSSTINPETYERPSLTFIAAVDVSGSMGWDYTGDPEYLSPGTLAKRLLTELAEQLDERDRIAIVTYGSDVKTALSLTSGDDTSRINNAIDRLREAGSTNMEAGLDKAYRIARDAVGGTEQTRVVLFTDARPNVGATGGSDFQTMAADGADDGIGLTVLGLGLGLGQDLVLAMSHLRGGNAFSFATGESVDTFMADHWPWFTSPIAYDMSLHVGSTAGYRLGDTYGFPASPESAGGDPTEISLDVATVFLSKKKGALLARIEREQLGEVEKYHAVANLRYTDLDGSVVVENLEVNYGGEEVDGYGQYFAQASAAKSTALAIMVSGMKEAAELYQFDREQAIVRMIEVHARAQGDSESLAAGFDDTSLESEIEFAERLLSLMQEGAPQGDFYPY